MSVARCGRRRGSGADPAVPPHASAHHGMHAVWPRAWILPQGSGPVGVVRKRRVGRRGEWRDSARAAVGRRRLRLRCRSFVLNKLSLFTCGLGG